MPETATAPLTGKALLQKVKEFSDLPRRETAKRCGYYTVTKNQAPRINLTEFYDAMLAAKAIALSPEATKDGRGREPNYRVSVQKNLPLCSVFFPFELAGFRLKLTKVSLKGLVLCDRFSTFCSTLGYNRYQVTRS